MFKYHDGPIPVPFLKFGWAKIGMEKLLIQDSIEGWFKVQSSRLRRDCKTLMIRVRGITSHQATLPNKNARALMSRIVSRMQPIHQPIQILPESQNFTYFCFRLSDMACPDCSRQLLCNVWRWDNLFVVPTTSSNFCLSEQFLTTFRFRAHIKHDKVNDFLKSSTYAVS